MSDESAASSSKSDIAFPKSAPLTLEIPSSSDSATSSVQSSQTSSPTGILESSTTSTTTTGAHTTPGASTSSLSIQRSQTGLNVKFAPLPELAPRKRRSTAPLGMAARAQLVRRRRQNHNYYDPDPGPHYGANQNPMWTEEELAEARARQVAAAMEKERQRREQKANAQDDDEDPFMVFGRLVKGASKQIWKKVAKKESKKDIGEKDREGDEKDGEGKEKSSEDSGEVKRSGDGSAPPTPIALQQSDSLGDQGRPPRLRSILNNSTPHVTDEPEEEGRVWEEEIGQEFLLSIGQTEAMIESRTQAPKKKKSGALKQSKSQPQLPTDKDLPPRVDFLNGIVTNGVTGHESQPNLPSTLTGTLSTSPSPPLPPLPTLPTDDTQVPEGKSSDS
ncbi:hypothetical protein CC1G_01068 [Coprinopsis cinerea okayama7|uniref:Uncharacterized protein n=1 Tax=Coprinopsis cinerea (strain Okayama-7 / 130 / ATCC MYA-4618 / FGSC 9003) TaxID=240176 RepID=A8NEE8_COPC7|nr:hypothetical protein CC1G_01068 [Coprinopsis cinerea okayama7\|eukprot:XP_001833006.1 hypothetical protein CC1G_01068 [Coprinopsis cinerea okayama7\